MSKRALFVAALVLLPAICQADPTIGFRQVHLDDSTIVASLEIPGLLDEDVRNRLASGREFETTIRFYLLRQRRRLPDDQLAVRSVTVTALYNAVTQEYLVNKSIRGEIFSSRTVRSLEDLKTELERLNDVPVFDLPVGADASDLLLKARLFLGMRYVLGLVPSERWTDKVSSRLTTAP